MRLTEQTRVIEVKRSLVGIVAIAKNELMSKKSPVTPAIKNPAQRGGFFNGLEYRAQRLRIPNRYVLEQFFCFFIVKSYFLNFFLTNSLYNKTRQNVN